ncbi:MAG: 3-deoxy-manno-octulosonate cytidylyltransferase [Legionella sp.]|jgi:3-deoxy-manno-octulosonate cytidylyltransferase (CMP-KDO synthetase)
MSTHFHIIIPARYQSTRFPGKLLMDLNGMTVLERVYRQALLAQAQSVVIATDNAEIATHAAHFGAKVIMTAPTHQSGTDRIAEVVAKERFADDAIVVNVQGDEPFIAPELITQVAKSLANSQAPMATLCWPIESSEQLYNPNVVKVVRTADEHALYFSRSPIPYDRHNQHSFANAFRHIGLYAYRANFLLDYVTWPVSELEALEGLEQLRVLERGMGIKVEQACVAPQQDINTEEDLAAALSLTS